MKCININDPEVKELIKLYGEVVTSAIIDEYNKNYADRDFSVDLATFIYNRLKREDKKKFEKPIVSKYITDVDELHELLRNSEYFQEIQDFLNSIDWFAISAAANKKLKQNKPKALQLQVERLKEFTPEEAREMAEGIVVYLTESYNYLDKAKRDLRAFFYNKEIPLTEKYKRGYFTLKMVNGFLGDLKLWKKTIGELGANNVVSRTIDSLQSVANDIERLFKEEALETIAEELATELAPQTNALIQSNQKEIDQVDQELKTEKDPIIRGHLEKRKNFLKEVSRKYATSKNLKDALSFGMAKVGEKDINFFSVWMENAALSSNILSGPIGSYLYNLHNETQRDVLEAETKLKTIVQKALNNFGGRLVGNFNKEEFLRPYVRKVKKMRVNKRGKKVYYEVYALNSEMDEAAYTLELEEKKYAISQETDPQRKKFLEKELRKFREENEYKGLSEEYYRIMSLLSPEAREARDAIIQDIQRLSSYGSEDILDEATLYQIEELQFKLARLESLYYENGERKPAGSLDEKIALDIQAWKKETKAANLFLFEPSEERLEDFKALKQAFEDEIHTAEQHIKEAEQAYLERGMDYSAVTRAKLLHKEAVSKYNQWKKMNVRRTVSPDFYELRSSLTKQIAFIQQKYIDKYTEAFPNIRTDDSIWEEIFNLLKGYRDKDNVYKGTDIPAEISERIKELQLELQKNREAFKDFKKKIKEADLDAYGKDQKRLEKLYESLRELQQHNQTSYYNKAYALHLAQVRALEVHKQAKNTPFIETEFKLTYNRALEEAKALFPSGSLGEHQKWATDKTNELIFARLTKEQETLEARVLKTFKQTKWYKDNHFKTFVWDSTIQQMDEVDAPLYFWTEILPKNEAFIDYESPSSRWNTFSINPDFVDSDYNFIPGRTQLRKSSIYKNDSYNNLSSEEKEILSELTEYYQKHQKNIPYSVAKGLELPSVRKRSQEGVIDYINPIKRVTTWGKNLWDDVRGLDEEKDSTYSGSAKASSEMQRRLLIRYTSPMDASIQSMDAFTSISMFAADSIRFAKIYEKSPFLYGLRDQLNSGKDAASDAVQLVNNFFDKQLFGEEAKTYFKKGLAATTERSIYKLSGGALGLSNLVYIGTRLPSAVKNAIANSLNAAIQSGTYGIELADILKGMGEGATHIHELFMSSIQTGNESEFVKKLRMFGIFDEALADKARHIAPTDLQKLNLVNPLKLLLFAREFLDIETRIGVALALSKQFAFQDINGDTVTIFNAYKEVDGIMVPRTDLFLVNGNKRIPVTPEILEAQHRAFIGKYHSVDALINGAQKNIDKNNLTRYGIGRLLMYMKSWFAYQLLRRFGGRRISYGGGFEYEGMYEALASMGISYFANLPIAFKNFNAYLATHKSFTNTQKKAAIAGLIDTGVLLTLIAVVWLWSGAIYGDDPEDKNGKFALYTISYVLDELETLHPIGWANYYYAREVEQNSQHGPILYFFKKNLLDPYNSVIEIYRSMSLFSKPEVDLDDPYIQRDKAGNIVTRKDIPVNPGLSTPITSMFGDNNSEMYAQFLKLSGLVSNINWIRNPEYTYNAFRHYYPKFYVQDLEEDKETIKSEVNYNQKRIKNLQSELKKADTEEKKEQIKLLLKETREELKTSIKQLNSLKNLEDDNVID